MTPTVSDFSQPTAQEIVCFPASFAQQSLWFIDQLNPGRATYNIPGALRVRGKLDLEVLKRTVDEVVRRHETLRTRFVTVRGVPQQVIEDQVDVQLPVVDLAFIVEEEREAEAKRLAQKEAQEPFDLQQAPLFRGKLLRLGAGNHVLLFTMHHIISDAWSMGVLIEEVSVLYGAFGDGQPSPLPELPIQYADYTAWQREWLEGGVLEEQLAYWKRQLAGSSVLLLPSGRPRPAVQSQNGATCEFAIGAGSTQKLKKLAEEQGATLFMVMLAAFQTLLYRYSGQNDIAVGTPTAGRSSGETENLIGFFINTLVLRGDLSGAPSFIELLQRTKEVTLEAYANQDVPFEKLVEVLSPERNLGSTPFFQIMLVLQNAPQSDLRLGAATLQPFNTVDNGTSKFDLLLQLGEDEFGKLTGSLQYSTDLFDAATMSRLIDHYKRLLSGIVDQPTQSIDELPFLTTKERQQVIEEWNRTNVEFPRRQCLPGLIEERVARAPEAIAVEHEGRTLTYRELNERANQWAWRLRELGVGTETRVGLMMERSLEMVVGLLGVLKAGAAYVPLDPDYPPERLSYMLESSQVKVLLTQSHLRERVPVFTGAVLELDGAEERTRIAEYETGNLDVAVLPEHLAYIIYTSGSTGRPKGVMNSHGGLVNRLLWMQEEYGLEAKDVVLQKTPFSFDVSVWEFLWPLMEGAKLVLARPGGHQEPGYLAALINQQQITTLHFVPSMLAVFLDEERAKQCQSIRRVVCSGEALPAELARRCLAAMPWAELHNLYGPTEAAIDVTYWKCLAEDSRASVPIGKGIANIRVYVVDKGMEPVPVGVPGELLLGGVGLARGYWGGGDLTAERFVPDGLSGKRGERLYRTGDLVRWLEDGNLEYLGRMDHQVKIRGQRIELGEIEAALQEHDDVRQAVVIVREDQRGEKRLVAYVVPERESEKNNNGSGKAGLKISELREHLLGKLPEYMVPTAYVQLEALPLNHNGKIDRKSLPEPDKEIREEEYVGARNATEETLCRLWQEVLRRDRIGIHDNFFRIGGHSLLAAQVTTRIRGALNADIPLRRVFELPTIAQLAGLIDQTTQSNGSNGAFSHRQPAIKRVARKAASLPGEQMGAKEAVFFPASFAQQSLWLIDQLAPGKATYNMPSALRIRGQLDMEVLKRTVREIVRRHETLRTRFVSVRGEPQQVVEDHVSIEVPVLDLTHVSGEQGREAEAMRQAREEAMQPFNLQQAPLFRAKLLRLDDLNHVLLLTMHHIISDGWSAGVLIQEVSVLYGAFGAGRSSPLPELPIQYADYSVWQREWLERGVLEQQLAYWRRQLAEPSMLALPTDRPRSAAQSQNGALYNFVLSGSLAQRLKKLADEQGATLFMVVLAAFQTLLYRYSGQIDIAVGTPIAGRNSEETEKLIGYFINTLVLRVALSGSSSFRQLIQRTKEVTLDAYANQDVPFEKLVEALSPERNLDSTPLFQVMLVLQNAPRAELQLGAAKLQPLDSESGTAKFELTVVLAENMGTDDGMYGTLEYNTDLFEKATMGRMVQHFQTLLESVASDSERAIHEITLMQEAERRQLLVEWNDTDVSYGRSECIQELFEEQARRTPQAPAVQYEGQLLTFEDLNRRANQLAHFLRKLGVGPEVRVGICVQRSFEMIVGLLGILKAGGTYVPLDPDHPQERLAYVLKDADVAVVLIHTETSQSIPVTAGRIVHLDDDWRKIEVESCQDPPLLNFPENAAFVIYTSGSTGKPKGVVVTHRALCNQMCWAAREFNISAGDRFAQKTSLTFDVSTEEIFVPLTAGATVILAKPNGERDLEYLSRFVEDEAITCIDLPPALLQVLLQTPRLGPWRSVRLALCGGEAVSAELVKNFYDKFSIRFVNVYGPTETTVQSTFADQLFGKEVIPIGRPVANTQVYVLDERDAPVQVGVVGELLIGGSGLARGYGNRPELTAERFVPNPFAKTPGERLYRTGDRVRWRADGNLEFLGRSDHQVKLRGYRIELGEIESALESHPNVAQSVVLDREDQPGSKRLVAYVINRAGAESPKASELEEYLKVRLPEYMVPAAFVALEKWPLNHNGKIDRKSLPQPDLETSEQAYVGPRNPTQETLCRLWQEVLQRDRVGIQDNFFKIGGHSLRAAQVAARMRESFKVEIPLRRMFESPTIAQLAKVIDQMVQTSEVNGTPSHLLPDIKRMARKAVALPMQPIGR